VPSKELFVRWVQNGIFQARFSIHSASDDNTVTEPWMYPEVSELVRELMLFRYRMVPYMYSLEYEASRTGAPIMRPLVYEFQEDPNVYDIDNEFMFGRDILVAGVLEEGQEDRMVYLPGDCVWYDMNDDFEEHGGGQIGPVRADLATVPMFIREGAIVPFALNQPMNLEKDKVTGLHLYLAPKKDGGESRYVLYEDDGVSNRYLQGEFVKTHITMRGFDVVDVDFKLEGSYENPVEDMFVEMIRRDRAPVNAWVLRAESDSAEDELPHYLYYKGFRAAERGWYYDLTRRTVMIKYPNPGCDYRLRVSFNEFDLVGM
jgi:alpha-glucosidase